MSDVVHVSPEVHKGELKRSQLRSGDVLLTITGMSYGKAAYVPPDFGDANINQHSVRMALKEDVLPEYVAMFLNSRFGKLQSDRKVTGDTRPALDYEEIRTILLPVPPLAAQEVVRRILHESEAKRLLAQQLYAEAERLLSAELGLDRLDLSESLFNVRRVSDVFNSKRLDAEYYQEKYYRLEDAITHHKYLSKPLSKLIEPIKNGFDFREFTEEGTPYIRVGDVRNGRIDFDNAAKIPVNSDEVQKDVGIKVGDVLFTRKGTFGNAAVVRKGQERAIISSEIMLLRLQKHLETPILPDYLALFLNSEFGYQQVTRKVHGVAYYSISQPDLAQVWVIAPPMDIQERLAGNIQASLEAEKDAKRLLAEAKAAVEGLIEKA